MNLKGGLKAVQTKKGPLLLIEGKDTQFLGWPKGIAFEDLTEEIAVKFQKDHEEQHRQSTQHIGEWNGKPIYKKLGKFGAYLQCDTTSIPFIADELSEKMVERFQSKSEAETKTFKNYVIRTGQYGPYIIKTSVKKAVFVSLPKNVDIATLTEKDIEGIYKIGLEAKKKWRK